MTVPQTLYRRLRLAGVTKQGACAVLANVQAESAFRENNLQDSFNQRLGITDEEFTRRVDAGDYSLLMTADLGYGLAQWTYPTRKQKLYSYAKSCGVSIENLDMQVSFLIKEFKEDFPSLWKLICSSTDLITCTDKLLEIWENPAVKDYSNRRNNANAWWQKINELEAVVGNSSTTTASSGSNNMTKVEQYTQAAIAIANDNSHGYSQTSRWGPDYDCSSLVISVVQNAGIPVRSRGASYTGNMRSVFKNCGFVDVTSQCNLMNASGMIRGDILLNDPAHVAIYIGNNQVVHARTDEGNAQSGDQSGNEIRVQGYWNYPWNVVLRYAGDNSVTSSSGSTSSSAALLSKGTHGAEVKAMQEKLLKLKYSLGKWGADGDYGDLTFDAVKEFQKDHGLPQTGAVDSATMAALDNAVSKASGSVASKPEFKVGDTVNFVGNEHYPNANAANGSICSPGKARITLIYQLGKSKHPYHLVKVAGGGSTVFGWVDEDAVEAV